MAKPHDRSKLDRARTLRARLEILVSTMPAMAWINPCWAMILSLPFAGFFHSFGAISAWNIGLILTAHATNSAVSLSLFRRYRREKVRLKRQLSELAVLQVLISLSWGIMPWLLWVDGNDANNVLVFTAILVIMTGYVSSRAMLMSMYVLATAPACGLAILRFATADGSVPWHLAILLGAVFLFGLALARVNFGHVEARLKSMLANDALTKELRRTRDEAMRKRFEAEAANASKTTFLANMSHELRTPLNAILGFSEIISHETLGPVGTPRYRDYAADIYNSGHHLLSIINDILDVAKIEAGRMEIEPRAFDPKPVLDKALRVVVARARERHQDVAVDIAPDLGRIFADERALRQIVINLGSNAVKFTQEGGKIAVRLRRTVDGGFLLCMEDNGPGIPTGLLDRIFKPFNQIDNRYNRQVGGTGLGLSLVRGLAELHGGQAWIESEPGAGVKAFVRFPPGSALEDFVPEPLRVVG